MNEITTTKVIRRFAPPDSVNSYSCGSILKAFLRREAGGCTGAARFAAAASGGCRTGRKALLTGILLAMIAVMSAQAVTDPTLAVTIQHTPQSVILSWPAPIAVPYQVESSSNLNIWTAASPVLSGTGATLTFTAAISSTATPSFFRVRRMFPAAAGTAVFDARTGLLTVVGDNLDNTITVSRDAAGTILVNNGAMPVTGGVATVTNTVLIQVLGLAGNDRLTVDTSFGAMPVSHLFGDAGDDTLIGGSGADLLVGGAGRDTLIGRGGNDQIYGGDDDDVVVWNPGDGSDTIEGQAGSDTILFNGANISENIDLSSNGGRLRFFRDIANVVLDAAGVETVQFNALGGADNVVVNNLSGTDVTQVNVDLASVPGGATGDAQADSVIINGTAGPDTFNVSAAGGAVVVDGAGAQVRVLGYEVDLDRVVFTGVGNDRVNVNGSAAADTMSIFPSPVAGFVRVTASGYSAAVDVIGALSLSVNGLGGPDTITGANGLATLGVPLIIDGGDGNDTLTGGDGSDLILGGAGDDVLSGGRGNDTLFGGNDNDTFVWNPGDGSDTIEGQAGSDTILFNGANISENIDLSSNGGRLRFFRDIANVVLDAAGVETVQFNALGGADNVVVNDLTGTAVALVRIELAATIGGTAGDAQADSITVNGTSAADTISVTAVAGAIEVSGLPALVRLTHTEAALDALIVNGLGGIDVLTSGAGVSSLIGLTLNQ